MGKDDELFEQAMEQIGVKDGARNAPRPTRKKAGPAKVEVSEELDFDALMRASRGPAREIAAAKKGAAVSEAQQATPAAKPTEAPGRAQAQAKRYAATAEESRQFVEAMAAIGTLEDGREPAPAGAARAVDELGRRLKRGDVAIDAVLDLHGKTRKEAQERLAAFIQEARAEGWELVSIVVGRGVHSDRGEAVLRPLVERWLREEHRADVSEVAAAPGHLGGAGVWIASIRARPA